MKFLLFASFVAFAVSLNFSDFGTKTAYRALSIPTPEAPPKQCTPIFSTILARHGSRNPGASSLKAYSSFEKKLSVTPPKIASLVGWKNPWSTSQEEILVPNGMLEHYGIGARLKSRFPAFFTSNPYSPVNYRLQETQKTRTGRSAASFTYGVFEGTGPLNGGYNPVDIFSETSADDNLLRFFDNCPKYLSGKKSPAVLAQYKAFLAGDEMKAVAARITDALGVSKTWSLKPSEASYVAELCAYEFALLNKTDGWCSALTEADKSSILFLWDLKSYYEKGPGAPLNSDMGCQLLKHVGSAISNATTSNLHVDWMFAHAETVIPFVTLLGLYNADATYTADMSSSQRAQRSFRLSHTPFASNVQFMVYNCTTGPPLVETLLNEKQFKLPGCDGVYCPVDTFLSSVNFNGICDFNAICGISVGCGTSAFKWLFFAAVAGIALIGIALGLRYLNRKQAASAPPDWKPLSAE